MGAFCTVPVPETTPPTIEQPVPAVVQYTFAESTAMPKLAPTPEASVSGVPGTASQTYALAWAGDRGEPRGHGLHVRVHALCAVRQRVRSPRRAASTTRPWSVEGRNRSAGPSAHGVSGAHPSRARCRSAQSSCMLA